MLIGAPDWRLEKTERAESATDATTA